MAILSVNPEGMRTMSAKLHRTAGNVGNIRNTLRSSWTGIAPEDFESEKRPVFDGQIRNAERGLQSIHAEGQNLRTWLLKAAMEFEQADKQAARYFNPYASLSPVAARLAMGSVMANIRRGGLAMGPRFGFAPQAVTNGGSASGGVSSGLGRTVDGVIDGVIGAGSNLVVRGALNTFLGPVATVASSIIPGADKVIGGIANGIGTVVSSTVKGFTNGVVSVGKSIVKGVGSVVKGIGKIFGL